MLNKQITNLKNGMVTLHINDCISLMLRLWYNQAKIIAKFKVCYV